MQRPPSAVLVVDANVLLSAALGVRTAPVIAHVGRSRLIVTSERAAEETISVIRVMDRPTGERTRRAMRYLSTIDVLPRDRYAVLEGAASDVLRSAPASGNGNTSDAHVLALAWTVSGDIWSHDRDFAGTGWPVWSSTNLSAALASA